MAKSSIPRHDSLGDCRCDYVDMLMVRGIDAKANKEMAEKAKGKGPMNAGQQGIKKSGKK